DLTTDGGVAFDIYPAAPSSAGTATPVVVFVAGYPDPMFTAMFRWRLKEAAGYTTWARAVAASGMTAVLYSPREPIADLRALLIHLRERGASLGLDATRLA